MVKYASTLYDCCWSTMHSSPSLSSNIRFFLRNLTATKCGSCLSCWRSSRVQRLLALLILLSKTSSLLFFSSSFLTSSIKDATLKRSFCLHCKSDANVLSLDNTESQNRRVTQNSKSMILRKPIAVDISSLLCLSSMRSSKQTITLLKYLLSAFFLMSCYPSCFRVRL